MQPANHSRQSTRLGIAPLEFIMFLPVLVGFILFMLWIYRVQGTAILTNQEAELNAIEQAVHVVTREHLLSTDQLHPSDVKELEQLVHGFVPQLPVGSGVVTGSAERDDRAGVPMIAKPIGSLRSRHLTLTHAWESEVFNFPQSPNAQAPLTLPACLRGIAPNFGDLTAFKQLQRFQVSSASLASVVRAKEKLQQNTQNATRVVRQQLQELADQADEIQQQITTLQAQLPVDQKTIAALQQELQRIRTAITELTHAMQAIQNMNRLQLDNAMVNSD